MSIRSKAATLTLIPLTALGAFALFAPTDAGATTKATRVTAVETDFHIKLSKTSFKPGAYIFVAENKGQTTHALQITGPGLHNAVTKDLSPGQTTTLRVTFKKGKYDVFCPIPGHKMLGMNVNLTIKSSGGTSTAAKTSGSSGGYGY